MRWLNSVKSQTVVIEFTISRRNLGEVQIYETMVMGIFSITKTETSKRI